LQRVSASFFYSEGEFALTEAAVLHCQNISSKTWKVEVEEYQHQYEDFPPYREGDHWSPDFDWPRIHYVNRPLVVRTYLSVTNANYLHPILVDWRFVGCVYARVGFDRLLPLLLLPRQEKRLSPS